MDVVKTDVIRVALVDDHPLIRESMSFLLSRCEQIRLVGAAWDYQGILHICESECPDVILMDINMPAMDGIEMTQCLLQRYPDLAVLMLTNLDDKSTLFSALEAGARGYLLKNTEINEIIEAIHITYQGKRALSPEMLETLIRHKPNPVHSDDQLTDREYEVLQLMCQGMTNSQIAERLYISASTVKYHNGKIYKKLQVSTRTQAISKAIVEARVTV